ncbi:MAG: YerC/YecD family TrpR-related protein [Lachnospiraceae bacterium]|nr:YerC/YecD family TrpR-related protein [Lachnospiraceae bacterium]
MIQKEEVYMKKNFQRTRKEDMYKAILQLETMEECMDFFEDICAETELRSIEQRFEVAKMLSQEKVYSDILSTTSASTATISRVNRVLNGGTGMLEKALKRLEESEAKKEK